MYSNNGLPRISISPGIHVGRRKRLPSSQPEWELVSHEGISHSCENLSDHLAREAGARRWLVSDGQNCLVMHASCFVFKSNTPLRTSNKDVQGWGGCHWTSFCSSSSSGHLNRPISLSLSQGLFLFCVCEGVPTCMCVYSGCTWYPQKSGEGIGAPRTGCEPPCECWALTPLQGQPVHLPVDLSPAPGPPFSASHCCLSL